MARQRTQKSISARIDRTYIDRPHPWRRMRRSAIFAAVAASIMVIAFVTFGGSAQRINNPGRLTFSHASFQNNCAACHDGCDAQGQPTSKFNLAVSDHACLKCHDAGVHNTNQATAVMMDMTRHPPEARSADCSSCHVEHRGQSSLITTSDLQCLMCHSDLTGKTLKPPATPIHMTAFSLDGHPHFGRALDDAHGNMVDPTNLRFNHKKHLALLPANQRDCTFCHNPNPDAAKSQVWETGKDAFLLPGDKGRDSPRTAVDETGRRASLTQVNYAANCEGCHALGTLPGSDVPIPHENMALVRGVISAYLNDSRARGQKFAADKNGAKEKPLNDRIASALGDGVFSPDYADTVTAIAAAVKSAPISAVAPGDAKLSPDLATALIAAVAKLPANILPAADRARVRGVITATTQPSGHLRPLIIARLRTAAVAGKSGDEKTKILAEFDAVFARLNQDTPDPRLIQAYVTYANSSGTSCIKCHDMQGDAAGVPSEWAALPNAKPPASDAASFDITPTGIPAGPRRWYVNSEFNHDAHRSMDCRECHTAALTSEKTSDILSPDIQWQGMKDDPANPGHLIAATRSCTECHHAEDSSSGPGAASNCTECHTYHDRTHEMAVATN